MYRDTSKIIVIAAAGQAISYGLAILLARQLGVVGFEAYAVASAIFIVMVALAPCGLDKYAIRAIPVLLARREWNLTRGFVRFGARRTLFAGLAMTIAGAAVLLWWRVDTLGEIRFAVLVAVIALPAGALTHFGLEVLSATGREILATAILRLGVPLLVLAMIGIATAAGLPLTGPIAVAVWGVAWVIVVVTLVVAIGRAMPPAVWRAPAKVEATAWRAAASLFWVHRAAMAVIAQASLIGLEMLQPSPSAVSAYAAALASTAPAIVLVTATNRIYARRLSVLLESGDAAGITALHRARRGWLTPAISVFLLVTVVFAERLLGLFGAAFVTEGTMPLRILAFTAAFTMLFALAPAYMKFTGQRDIIFRTLFVAVVAQMLLLAILVPRFGATGAAFSYALSMIGLYGTFAVLTRRGISRLAPGH